MHGTCSGSVHFHVLQNVLIHAEKSWQPHTPLQSFCSLAQACPRPRPRACCATLLLCFGWESPMHTWTVCGSPGWGKVPVCCSCAVLHAGPRCAAKHQRRQPWMQHNVCHGRPMLYHIDPRTWKHHADAALSVHMAREPVCVAERGHRARGAGAPEEPAGSLQKLSTHTATQWLLACATVPLPCLQRGTLQKCLRTSGEASRVLRRALSSSPL